MSNPNYGKTESNVSAGQDPPPYSEKLLSGKADQQALPAGLIPPMGYEAPPPVPQQCQLYYGPPGAGFSQATVLQPPQIIVNTAVEPVNEPDYLGFSLFTMLCCCLPIGIAALVYSIKTRDANRAGDGTNAQQYSKLARTLSHMALGVGIGGGILYLILRSVTGPSASDYYQPHYSP